MFSYQYADKHMMFQTTNGYLFETEDQAGEFCRLWNEHFEAMASLDDLPNQLSREQYEETCQRLGVAVMSDNDCDAYGVRYGEYGPWSGGYRMEDYTPDYCVQMALARRRLYALDAEAKPSPQIQPDYPRGKKLDCGCVTFFAAHVMNASLGSSCQDCYDRMSG